MTDPSAGPLTLTGSVPNLRSLVLGRLNEILELKIYRKWVSRNLPNMTDLALCCIALDRDGNAIQVNMDINHKTHFNQLLKEGKVYRILRSFIEPTNPFQQTLQNPLSLGFGLITKFEELPGAENDYPEHYFEFVPHNELSTRIPYPDGRGKLIYPSLADYVGCIRRIYDPAPAGTSRGGSSFRRKVEIEDLDGNIVEFTMWDPLARQFNKDAIEKLMKPVIIAVTACRVTKYKDYQLAATSATHFYIGLHTPFTNTLHRAFQEKFALTPPLQVTTRRHEQITRDPIANNESLATLLQHDPKSYRGFQFACEATIIAIEEDQIWHYISCIKCNKRPLEYGDIYICRDHGEQELPSYKYNFRATVSDGNAVATFTFFSPAGDELTARPCVELGQKYRGEAVRRVPKEITDVIGYRRRFIVQFVSNTRQGAGEFIVSNVMPVEQPTDISSVAALYLEGSSHAPEPGAPVESVATAYAEGITTPSKTEALTGISYVSSTPVYEVTPAAASRPPFHLENEQPLNVTPSTTFKEAENGHDGAETRTDGDDKTGTTTAAKRSLLSQLETEAKRSKTDG